MNLLIIFPILSTRWEKINSITKVKIANCRKLCYIFISRFNYLFNLFRESN